MHWHQDVAYFPLKPNNQLAVWFPLEIVTEERGAMGYALGSHKLGARGSIALHTRHVFDHEERPLIPDDPSDEGMETKIFEMSPKDMLVHDGYTWHYSGPNLVENHNRKGISVRFITDEAVFDPRPGQGAAFTKQIEINKGDKLILMLFQFYRKMKKTLVLISNINVFRSKCQKASEFFFNLSIVPISQK